MTKMLSFFWKCLKEGFYIDLLVCLQFLSFVLVKLSQSSKAHVR